MQDLIYTELLIYSAIPSKSQGFKNAFVRAIVQYFSKGSASHSEIRFKANAFLTAQPVSLNPFVQFQNKVEYTFGMGTHGLETPKWKDRLAVLEKSYVGVITPYIIHDVDYSLLYKDIKNCYSLNLKYPWITSFASSKSHTLYGKFLLWLTRKSRNLHCSALSFVTLVIVSPSFRAMLSTELGFDIDMNNKQHFKIVKAKAKEQTPVEIEKYAVKCSFKKGKEIIIRKDV